MKSCPCRKSLNLFDFLKFIQRKKPHTVQLLRILITNVGFGTVVGLAH